MRNLKGKIFRVEVVGTLNDGIDLTPRIRVLLELAQDLIGRRSLQTDPRRRRSHRTYQHCERVRKESP